jgi:phosphoserine phosphatase
MAGAAAAGRRCLMALVFVDVDGTLVPGAAADGRFLVHLLAAGHLGPRQVLRALVPPPRREAGGRVPHLLHRRGYFAGLPTESVKGLARRFVGERLAPLLRSDLLHRLQRHRRGGDRVVLLTAMSDLIAEPLRQMIGADDAVATCVPSRQGRLQPGGSGPFPFPFAAGKLDAAEAMCAAAGARLAAATAYADSMTDLPLLRQVGTPVVVAPHRELRRLAERYGWEIVAAVPISPQPRVSQASWRTTGTS